MSGASRFPSAVVEVLRSLRRGPSGSGFPIDRLDERCYDAQWQGDIITCDIDRTYLATRFSSFSGLAKIPFEFGIDKIDIAGMATLLKEARRGPGEDSRYTPLYFVSASPAQLRATIQRKMLLDGLEYDGTTFKRWGAILLAGRKARLRDQVGYKVTALLTARLTLPAGARDVLIGDDNESDPQAFLVYADILAGRVPQDRIVATLTRLGAAEDDAAHVVKLVARVGQVAPVRRVYIRLERGTPESLRDCSPHLRACRGAFQMALGFFDDGGISTDGVLRVTRDLHQRGTPVEELSERFVDAISRALLGAQQGEVLYQRLAAEGLLSAALALPERAESAWLAGAERATWLPE